jgi:hypothetical protein
MADACMSFYNASDSKHKTRYINKYFLWLHLDSYCPAYFDRLTCWPPTEAGVRRILPCPEHIFPNANPEAYASRLCTNNSQWEERSHYELCIGCSPNDPSDVVYLIN